MPPLIQITAADIDTAGLEIDRDLPADWLRHELGDVEIGSDVPGRVTARLSRSGGAEIVVRGRVRASLTLPCARCLEPAHADVEGELSLLLKPAAPQPPPSAARKAAATPAKEPRARRSAPAKEPASAKREPEYEFTSEEAEIDHYDGERVVLDPFIREAILLEVPNFPLCSESCPGIAPAPIAAQATAEPPAEVDPRLAPLGALRDRLASADAEKKSPATARADKKQSPPAKSAGRKSKSNKE